MKKDENMRLKNKFLFCGWISIAAKAYRHDKIIKKKNLPHRFEDWIYKKCKIKKQTTYIYRNFYKLMSIPPNLLKCRLNMTHFVKNYEIFLDYFEENEEQIPGKHNIYCPCEAFISHFSKE